MALRPVVVTRNLGAISVAESILKANDIYCVVAGWDSSDGGVGVQPVKVLVPESDVEAAKKLLVNIDI
ncbi:MAG: DUF2007 domain-containing protein [Pseudomonadota bacterium]